MSDCLRKINIMSIDRMDANDLTAIFAVRYRLASDPDVDASYTTVTTTKTNGEFTYPYFDPTLVPEGTYVIHGYAIAGGTSTGEKATVSITCVADALQAES